MNANETKATQIQSKGVEHTAPVLPLQQPVARQQPPTGIAILQASVGNSSLAAAASNGSLESSSRLFPVQSTYGNAAASRSLQPKLTAGNKAAPPPFDTGTSVQRQPAKRGIMIQPKLTVGAAHDPYEQEADRVAQQVMSMSTPPSTNTCQATVQEQTPEKDAVAQTKPLAATITSLAQRASSDSTGSFEPGADFESRLSASGGGSPLPASTRAFMEPRFGADFSGVRLHTGGEAAQLNRAINAQAFTQCPDIYLGEGKNDVESSAGKQLLAHELTHTIQQGANPALQRERLADAGSGLVQRDGDTAATGATPQDNFDTRTFKEVQGKLSATPPDYEGAYYILNGLWIRDMIDIMKLLSRTGKLDDLAANIAVTKGKFGTARLQTAIDAVKNPAGPVTFPSEADVPKDQQEEVNSFLAVREWPNKLTHIERAHDEQITPVKGKTELRIPEVKKKLPGGLTGQQHMIVDFIRRERGLIPTRLSDLKINPYGNSPQAGYIYGGNPTGDPKPGAVASNPINQAIWTELGGKGATLPSIPMTK